ncbi:hypothetical protein GCM10025865_05970 [Paraoerskovia sediminicola]|uniref:DUF4229 domain-containing protein n=1 Tax=Paraoerskovia sediminicola TaxID=1138587 RepID=A0ABM8FZX7_9CELL|nr:DUF4229 domain-containing protein [Paraoerskovia sediminicola]BDZ41298.1 hypothetical protein GCM10025865_05970 [Paraoerskovia sediminicola]
MPLVLYSVLRLLLFAVALGGLYLAGLRGWLLVVVAAAIALMVSYLALARPRDAASRYLAQKQEARSARTARGAASDVDAAAEDAAVDGASGHTSDGASGDTSDGRPDAEPDDAVARNRDARYQDARDAATDREDHGPSGPAARR